MLQPDDESLSSPLLRVIDEKASREFGSETFEEHLIPLVDAIVPETNAAMRTLYITPPPGLLQLGRQRMLLNYLRHALLVCSLLGVALLGARPMLAVMDAWLPLSAEVTAGAQDLELPEVKPAAGAPAEHPVVHMPVREQLVAVGRQDLIRYINEAGGFLEVSATHPHASCYLCTDIDLSCYSRHQARNTRYFATLLSSCQIALQPPTFESGASCMSRRVCCAALG